MQPVIKHLEALAIVGLSARFISAMSPDANNFTVIPKLWDAYLKRSGEIKSRLSPIDYGVVVFLKENDQKSHPDERLYIAGASSPDSAPTPEGMTRLTIPAGKYAVFTHKGILQNLPQTMKGIHTSWLSDAGLKMRSGPHLEIYDSRFNPVSPASELDICIPIEA
jgi:AraC family transcriptional regulator